MKRKGLYVIGLTGNIAVGKSVVAAMLAELGAYVIDADALAHEIMQIGTPTWQGIVDEFGTDILLPDGQIDRAKLGAMVFADPAALAHLEAIVHPAVVREAERRMESAAHVPDPTGIKIIVLEAIKLIESGMHQRCDELWVVTCPREQQVQRLMANRGMSLPEAELRITAQHPQEEKIALANVVIENSGDLAQTRVQVQREWERIHATITTTKHKVEKEFHSSLIANRSSCITTHHLLGGAMSSWRKFIEEHPFLTTWAVLAVGMVVIFLITSRGVDLLPSQRLFMAVACVALAGLCAWIVSWE
ncbi:MAG: dephospho-CoA kinase [Anaerolineae bacterium]